jgi:hypothetical protein
VIPPVIQEHADRLRASYPQMTLRETAAANAVLVEVPDVKLPPGWNRETTTVRFLIPLSYPNAAPDCFWADDSLALEDGREPQGTNHQPIPGESEPRRWFSWHVQQWNPNSHTVSSFLQVILDRLNRVV